MLQLYAITYGIIEYPSIRLSAWYVYYVYRCDAGNMCTSTHGPERVHVHVFVCRLFTLLDLCLSSLRRGHANILCIVQMLTDDPRKKRCLCVYASSTSTCALLCCAMPCRVTLAKSYCGGAHHNDVSCVYYTYIYIYIYI